MEALLQFGSRLFDRVERLVRAGLTAAKHQELSGIVFWAALIGICGAFTGVGFRASVRLVQHLLTRSPPGLGLVETAEPEAGAPKKRLLKGAAKKTAAKKTVAKKSAAKNWKKAAK